MITYAHHSFHSALVTSLCIHAVGFFLIYHAVASHQKIFVDVPIELMSVAEPLPIVSPQTLQNISKPAAQQQRSIETPKPIQTSVTPKPVATQESTLPVPKETLPRDVQPETPQEQIQPQTRTPQQRYVRGRVTVQPAQQQQTFVPTVRITNFPYAYYVKIVQGKVGAYWEMPQQTSTYRYARVYFRIIRSGVVSECTVEASSNDGAFDDAAVRAVKRAAPFPPLPDEYKDEYVGVYFGFEYTNN